MQRTEDGCLPESEGWFVVNVADAQGRRHERFGLACTFEGPEARFPQLGINVRVLDPGQPASLYHSESVQEGFLVLSGEGVLVVEDEERRLRAWDFVHCPPGTSHVLVGAGEAPCAILMVGTRSAEKRVHYPVSEVAARYGASVREPTDSLQEAYRDFPRVFTAERMAWPLER